MTTAERLAREFAPRGVASAGVLLLPVADALDLVRRARAERVPILGLGAFRVEGAAIRPDHAQTLDFSGASCRTNPWSEAESFLEDRVDSALHFEVALGEGPP